MAYRIISIQCLCFSLRFAALRETDLSSYVLALHSFLTDAIVWSVDEGLM